jgi:hypothetical protein
MLQSCRAEQGSIYGYAVLQSVIATRFELEGYELVVLNFEAAEA